MPRAPVYSNESLNAAIQSVREGCSVNKAARDNNIPESSLRKKIKNGEDSISVAPWKAVLTKEEESQLYQWILRCADAGQPRSARQIIIEAGRISVTFPRERHFPNGLPSKMWLCRFLRRCGGEIVGKKMKIITLATGAVTEIAIRAYFRRVESYLHKNNLFHLLHDRNKVANCDETYLWFAANEGQVFTRKGARKGTKKTTCDPKTHLTVLHTILADGNFMSPYVVYNNERMPPEVVKNFPAEGVQCGKTKSGWMDSDTFLDYLKKVIKPYLDKNGINDGFLLLVDNHWSHTSLEVAEYCRDNQIHLLCLYPNSTFILQPLDVGVFGAFKKKWTGFLLDEEKDFKHTINKSNFAGTLKKFMDKYSESLRHAVIESFKNTGVYPWNVENVKFDVLLESSRLRKDEPAKASHIEDDSVVFVKEWPDACGQAAEDPDFPLDEVSETQGSSTDTTFTTVIGGDQPLQRTSGVSCDDIFSFNENAMESWEMESVVMEIVENEVSNGSLQVTKSIQRQESDFQSEDHFFIEPFDVHDDGYRSMEVQPLDLFSDSQRKAELLEMALAECSPDLEKDLLAMKCEPSNNYNIHPAVAYQRLIQKLKPPETANDILPIPPQQTKKSNVKRKLVPEFASSSEFIALAQTERAKKIKKEQEKEASKTAREEKAEAVFKQELALTENKSSLTKVKLEIKRYNRLHTQIRKKKDKDSIEAAKTYSQKLGTLLQQKVDLEGEIFNLKQELKNIQKK